MEPRVLKTFAVFLMLCMAFLASGDIVPNPTSAAISQRAGVSSVYNFILSNTGNTSQSLVTYKYGTAQSWVSLPSSISLGAGSSQTIYYTIDIPSSASSGNYNFSLQFLGATQNTTNYLATVEVNSTATTTVPAGAWDMVADREWFDLGNMISFGDYAIEVTKIREDKAKLSAYEDDELEASEYINEGQNLTLISGKIKVEVHSTNEDDRARLTIWSDDDYDYEVSEGGASYTYTLITSQQFPKGTTINFGQFYITIGFIAQNGVYITRSGGYTIGGTDTTTCMQDEYCYPEPSIRMRVNSITSNMMGGGTVTLTVDATERYLVTTTTQSVGGQCNYNTQCEYWLGEGATCSDCSSTGTGGTGGQTLAGNLAITPAGKIAPRSKVYFIVTDPTSLPIQSGILTVDAGHDALMVDIQNGYARVELPPDLSCPVGVTASAPGYQITTKIFSSCSEEGRINWTEITTTTVSGSATTTIGNGTLVITHSTPDKLGDTTIITVVSESQGVPLASMQIVLPNNNIVTSTTNSDGRLSLTLDQTGNYKITASKAGYVSSDAHEFDVSKKPLSITIDPESPKIGQSVTIMAKSDAEPLMGVDLEITLPNENKISRSTTSSGTTAITTEKTGEHHVYATKTNYETVDMSFTVKGKAMEVSFSPEAPTCGQSVHVTAKDTEDSYALTGVEYTHNGNDVAGGYFTAVEGQNTIIATKDSYQEVSKDVTVTCAAVLQIPPLNIKKGESAYAKWNKDVEWTLTCDSSEGNVTFAGSGATFNRTISSKAMCRLSWADRTYPFEVKGGGLGLSFEGNTVYWIIAIIAVVLFIVVLWRRGTLQPGGGAYFYPGKGSGGDSGPVAERL